eukprot:6211232-Pleurochrysis_carterae.AAC.2
MTSRNPVLIPYEYGLGNQTLTQMLYDSGYAVRRTRLRFGFASWSIVPRRANVHMAACKLCWLMSVSEVSSDAH